MDVGDLIFYGILIVSAVTSILSKIKRTKAEKVNPDEDLQEPATVFDPEKIWREMMGIPEPAKSEIEDDFLPSSPKTVQADASPVGSSYRRPQPKASPTYETSERFRRSNESLEHVGRSKTPRTSSLRAQHDEIPYEDTSMDGYFTLDALDSSEELKKAVIYHEILQRKF
jgi:hypothetical protein